MQKTNSEETPDATIDGGRTLPDWQRAGDESLPRATIRSTAEDFEVEEVLGFEFSGDGEHDCLWLEKRATNSSWLARRLAEFAGVDTRDVGFAGLKDRHALTRQWFTVRRPAGDRADWGALAIPGVTILDATRNRRKLRRGAHAANIFQVRLSSLTAAVSDDVLQRLASRGVPNYFGEQRFGRQCQNLQLADVLFGGKRLRRERRSFALSAARAWVFNRVLQERVRDGSWERLAAGDIACLDGSNSIFKVGPEESGQDSDIEQRLRDLDIHAAGPLWGKRTDKDSLMPVELAMASKEPSICRGLEEYTDFSRRPLRAAVRELDWRRQGDTLMLKFRLARGSYATAVLRELVDYLDASRDDAAR